MFLDSVFNVLVRPFFLIPTVAAAPMGVLTSVGVPMSFQFYIMFAVFYVAAVAIISILENRLFVFQQDIFNSHKFLWSYFRTPFIILNYLTAPLYFKFLFSRSPNQVWALEELEKKLPGVLHLLKDHPIFVMCIEIDPAFAMVFVFVSTLTVETVVIGGLLVRTLKKYGSTKTMSKSTLELHNRFLRALFVQISIPFVLIIGPSQYIVPAIYFDMYHQTMNNICVITLSLYGLGNSVVMIYIHEPYRTFCVGLLSFWKTSADSVSAAASSGNSLFT